VRLFWLGRNRIAKGAWMEVAATSVPGAQRRSANGPSGLPVMGGEPDIVDWGAIAPNLTSAPFWLAGSIGLKGNIARATF
jgi:hypothetical protein